MPWPTTWRFPCIIDRRLLDVLTHRVVQDQRVPTLDQKTFPYKMSFPSLASCWSLDLRVPSHRKSSRVVFVAGGVSNRLEAVQKLVRGVAGDHVTALQQAVAQGALAVVHVGDDASANAERGRASFS